MVVDMIENYQPYFRAYLLHNNIQTGDTVKSHEYIAWNGRKWEEWRKLNGLPRPFPATKEHHSHFETWLFETVPLREGQLTLFLS